MLQLYCLMCTVYTRCIQYLCVYIYICRYLLCIYIYVYLNIHTYICIHMYMCIYSGADPLYVAAIVGPKCQNCAAVTMEELLYQSHEVADLDRDRTHTQTPWADPKSRTTLGFCNLHHGSIRVQSWGIYCWDPPGGLGSKKPRCLMFKDEASGLGYCTV